VFNQVKGYVVGGAYVAVGILATALSVAVFRIVKDKVSK